MSIETKTDVNEHSGSSACSTDIDRLHHVVQSKYGPLDRGVGKTFAHCHELCGVLETGQSRVVLCLVEHMRRIDHIVPMLERVFAEHGIAFAMRGNRRVGRKERFVVLVPNVGEREVRFVRFDDDRALCGVNCDVVEFHD